MVTVTRRTFVETAIKGSTLYLCFTVQGGTLLLTPEQARAKDVPLRKLSDAQAQTLEILGEAIVPGSAKVGLTHFLDHQLGADPNEALLIAKYFGVALPYSDFYAAGAGVAEAIAERSASKSIAQMAAAELNGVIKQMSAPGTVVDGFPIFLFYMCLRSDAVDVVYGTPEGFEKLNIPYMQHIMPPEGWDG
jgi:hypothetical protein